MVRNNKQAYFGYGFFLIAPNSKKENESRKKFSNYFKEKTIDCKILQDKLNSKKKLMDSNSKRIGAIL